MTTDLKPILFTNNTAVPYEHKLHQQDKPDTSKAPRRYRIKYRGCVCQQDRVIVPKGDKRVLSNIRRSDSEQQQRAARCQIKHSKNHNNDTAPN